MNRRLYSLLVSCLLPLTLVYLLWRARKQPEYLRHWRERFAWYPIEPAHLAKSTVIWLHAVSVGETRAAQPLIEALLREYPNAKILLTHTTPTGRATSEALFGDRLTRCYLPYDTPGAVRRFFRYYRPALGLIVETELWPNLLAEAKAAGIPTLLVNARLSERSAKGYRRFAQLTAETLACLSGIGAQTAADADRLRALGAAHIQITGNIKFDITPPEALLACGAEMRERAAGRSVFLCASTREGEEELILDAWHKVSHRETAHLLVIVPRHPQRFDEVASLAERAGFRVQRRSQIERVEMDTQVIIGDSMGEMFAYYAAADVAFVGGSLLDFGCQNLIEPCSVGTPVLIGPSTFNFAETASEALSEGAAITIQDAESLVRSATIILDDPSVRAKIGGAGLAFISKHKGATAKTLLLVEQVVSRPSLH